MRTTARLMLEALEDRCTPTSLGQTWPEPGRLTLGFVPDGTMLSGAPSNLFASMNRLAPAPQWQQVVLKAFQTWAVNTNVNVGVVPDDGTPLGTDGAVQGDPRFGDIRIGMQALPANLVATTSPFSWTGSTWSGDVILNSTYPFTLGGTTGYNLFTVALHEAGHALGIPDNTTDPNSIMYASYLGPRTGLDSLDIANVQTLYGVRAADSFDAAAPNKSLGTATPLGSSPSQLGFVADLTTATDVDYYKIVTPVLDVLPVNVTIQIDTAGLSGLVPTLSVYNHAGQLLARKSGASPLDGNVAITLNNVAPLTTLYIEVGRGQSGVFGIGAYTAQITYTNLLSSLVGLVPALIPGVVNTVNHLNTSIASATMLTAPWGNASDQRFNYLYQANLVYGGDVDYYKFQAPSAPSPTGSYALDAIVWQTTPGGLAPALHLYDASGNPVPAEVMTDTPGVFALQVRGVAPGMVLYVAVAGQTASGAGSTGGYVYGARFNTMPEIVAPLLGSNTLPTPRSTDSGVLAMNQNGVFYFELAAASGSGASSVTMTVVSAQGQTMLSMIAATGAAPRTAAAYLPAGTYTIHYSITAAASPWQPVTYWLSGKMLSDPIGPYYSGSNPPPPPPASSTTGSSTNGNPTVSSTTTFASAGASVSISAPDGSVTSVPIPPPGAGQTYSFTTTVGTTTVAVMSDSSGNTTVSVTTPSANTITDSTTTSGNTSTETLTTSDGIQVTITMPATTSAPSYAGPSSPAPPPYYY